MLTLRIKPVYRRCFAATLAMVMITDVCIPVRAWALTGGPSQPEVQSFEPIGTSDMVDLFSGDFSYNIPLIDMDGYPVNLSYHSGITMDQEASWVGLGWNINPGVINRNMRGVPDDFAGDEITKEFNMKPNKTFGLNGGYGLEIFGSPQGFAQGTLNMSVGVTFNNYSGIGIEKSLNLGISAGNKSKLPLNGNLGLTSSSDNGLTIQPSLGLSFEHASKDKGDGASSSTLGINIGTAFNSRGGLRSLTINTSISAGYQYAAKEGRRKGSEASNSTSVFGTASSFDLGSYNYTPSVSMPMHNFSISANFKLGGELFGAHGNFTVGGYFSSQKLITNSTTNPAYGYMHYDEGVNNSQALLDFNRENDGAFVSNVPALPMSSLTYDIYSVSGQGVGGSYRPFRSDMGYIYDASSYSTSDGFSIGGEYGFGNLAHAGGDVTVNMTSTQSGRWLQGNNAQPRLRYTDSGEDNFYEPFYFKEANEKSVESDQAYYNAYGSAEPQRFSLNSVSKFNTQLDPVLVGSQGNSTLPTDNTRDSRDKRNQMIYQLTRSEVENGLGINEAHPNAYNAPDHHIGEITTYGNDGMRYVYGVPAYNTLQYEVSFATGDGLYNTNGNNSSCATGLVDYSGNDNSALNDKGIDNYYNKVITPAFAHSYLLSSVLSPDYVDADTVKGPSDGDLGYYTQFHYSVTNNYKWRVPFEANKANHNEGLKSDPTDDKGSYIYGTKEIWYLDSIVSKNYIAIFHTEKRKDGWGVVGENGGIETDTTKGMRLLRKISLYSLPEYRAGNAVPIKEVHFEYDYSLCPGVPNNNGVAEMVNGSDINAAEGKLTLRKVYFTYQNSNKAKLSPYVFNYDTPNPGYDLKGYNRWGNYKPNGNYCTPTSNGLPAAEYPYVEQNKTQEDTLCASWSLNNIQLPSGGRINVDYESDDYAYVQNKKAMQMFKIIGVVSTGTSADLTSIATFRSISDDTMMNRRLLVELQDDYGNLDTYLDGIENLYFRCLMRFDSSDTSRCDYVSGYAQIDRNPDSTKIAGFTTTSGNPVAIIKLKSVKLKDNGDSDYNPISKCAIQFGRLNLSQFIWDQPTGMTGEEGFDEQVLTALINSSFVKNISDAIQGPNLSIWKDDRGRDLVTHKSWVRFNNPSGKKLGGGSRVKKIRLSDEFDVLTGNAMPGFEYGQEYNYSLEDGTSSGVASYEPQLGGDENPWKQPIYYDEEKLLAPDDQHYVEEPLGESYFPSASVGYSRVTVTNLQHANVTRNATGKVVHEFYTAKDYPTIVKRTDLVYEQDKTDPFSITSLLYTNSRDHMTATQGFSVELNDMHGKQKKQMVYQENQSVPITEVEYKYQSEPYLNGSFHLTNNASVIDKRGNVSTAQIGVFYDMAADMREFRSEVSSIALQLNLDAFVFPPLPTAIPVPMVWPSLAYEETQFRSATTTKVIQRFGLLEEVIARDLGSVVNTENLAYDAETGELLLTSVTTDFNDKVYNLTYPAHWYYEGMGQAYRNIGYHAENLTIGSNGQFTYLNAKNYFVPGDELAVTKGSNTYRAWVTGVSANAVEVMKKDGLFFAAASGYSVKVIRSGRRNLATVPIATITSLEDPRTRFSQNIFNNVLQASASEYSDQWRTFCDCFDDVGAPLNYTINPYVLGTRGNWRMKQSWLHLSPRTQSNYNDNSNIRKDGVFASYTPFYKLTNNRWAMDERNWTFTSEVTEASPYGPELENRDALGRYSASTYGYKQTFPTGVAANARYNDIGTDNFEDYGFSPCADNHFKFTSYSSSVSDSAAHSGRHSIRVVSGAAVSMHKQLSTCDPAGCTIALSTSTISGGKRISISNGTAPYQITWNVINGDPVVAFASATAIDATGSSCTIEVIVTDAEGCKTSLIVTL